jgi:hypothetical protein
MVRTANKAKPYAPASGTAICDLVWRTGLPTDPTIAYGEAHPTNGGPHDGFRYGFVNMKSASAASHWPSPADVTVHMPGAIAQVHRDLVEVDSDRSVHGGYWRTREKNILPLVEGQRR